LKGAKTIPKEAMINKPRIGRSSGAEDPSRCDFNQYMSQATSKGIKKTILTGSSIIKIA